MTNTAYIQSTSLELFYPTRPFHINQHFAENNVCSNPDRTGIVLALPDGTCPDGKVKLYPLLGLKKGHTGIDLYAPDGWIVRAPFDGVVKELQLEPERGLGIGVVTHDRRDMREHGEHYAKARQWHGKMMIATLGQTVKVGDPIMLANNTGYSTGSHVHFELKPVEYDNSGRHYNTEQNNGFFGAVDPEPFLNGMYAEDYARWSAQIKVWTAMVNYWISQIGK